MQRKAEKDLKIATKDQEKRMKEKMKEIIKVRGGEDK